MDETCPPLIHDFTDDEIEVANILANIKSLIPPYDPPSLVPSSPSWLSKRPRSASVSLTKSLPDRLKGDSDVVSGKGNRRNASPDSPLLLKYSPERCCVQGGSNSTRDKKGMTKQGRPLRDVCKTDDDNDGDVDHPVGVIRSKKKLKNEAMGGRDGKSEVPESDFPVQNDVTLTLCGQPRGQLTVSQLALADGDRNPDLTVDPPPPHGCTRTSLTSPPASSKPRFLFNLNLLPESANTQSTPPHQDRKPGQTPCDCAATYDGISQTETARAARKRRLDIYRIKNGKGGAASKAHPSLRHQRTPLLGFKTDPVLDENRGSLFSSRAFIWR